MKYLVFTFLMISLAPNAIAQVSFQNTKGSFDIYYYLYREADAKVKPIEKVTLVCDTLDILITLNLDSLLLKRGIFPDAEAYNLIYYLNPNLNSLRNPKSSKIIFPNFDQTTKRLLEIEQKDNFYLVCTTNYSIRDTIFKMITALTNGLPIDKKIRKTNVQADQILAVFNSNKSEINTITQMIINRNSILNRRNLIQIKEGVSLLLNIQKKDTIYNADIEKLNFLKDNLTIMTANLNLTRGDNKIPDPYPEQDVKVVVKNAHGAIIKGLRIYFVAKAFLDEVKLFEQFPMLSSPSIERLPIANYFIWAGSPGSPNALTDRYPLNLRKQTKDDPLVVELVTK